MMRMHLSGHLAGWKGGMQVYLPERVEVWSPVMGKLLPKGAGGWMVVMKRWKVWMRLHPTQGMGVRRDGMGKLLRVFVSGRRAGVRPGDRLFSGARRSPFPGERFCIVPPLA